MDLLDNLFDAGAFVADLLDSIHSVANTILTPSATDDDYWIDFALFAAPVLLAIVFAVSHYRNSRTQAATPLAATEPAETRAVDDRANRPANVEEQELLANARARLDEARRQQTAALGHATQPQLQPRQLEHPAAGGDQAAEPAGDNQPQQMPPPNTAAQLPNMPVAPKRVGKKRAANLERKENLRRYREWQVSSQQEQEQKRMVVNAEKDRIAAQKEAEAQERERKRMREELERIRRIEREEAKKELEEAGKPSVYSMEDTVLEYIEGHIVIHLEHAARELNVRLEELEVYLEEKIEEGEWAGHLDLEQGQFIYLDPTRIAAVRARLEAEGKVSKSDIAAILLDPTTTVHREILA
ncbi:hypothetical protein BCR44DRAFT_50145 [Catenaria anguillulae PL171]|uniref:DDRGK domain-containing protein 1 n=1 Tax=Catenaria anguillulae PL171 TaxID=765915 RepID=A0A1Y2I433_9FUNG|nr:hypothetical protein BCR44DRAFT_50145 [Catenaria anguillulae PL171]